MSFCCSPRKHAKHTSDQKHRAILLLSLKGKWCRTWGFWLYRWKEEWGGPWEEACGPWNQALCLLLQLRHVLNRLGGGDEEDGGWTGWGWRGWGLLLSSKSCRWSRRNMVRYIGRAVFYQVRQALSWETHFFLEVLFAVFLKKQNKTQNLHIARKRLEI